MKTKNLNVSIIALMMLLLCLTAAVPASAAADRMVSTADFTYRSFTALSGRATIEFDICATTVSDGIVGITASTITPANYTDYAICFRIRAGAFFDANNGSSYTAASTVNYEKGKTYHVIIDADTANQTYSAYVVIDGVKKTVADNYAFRTKASDLGKITARGGGGVAAGLYYIENMIYTQGEGKVETLVLPNFFMNDMVVQRGESHVIYGESNADNVYVTMTNGTHTSSGSAKPSDGKFAVKIDPLPASLNPYKLTVSTSARSITIDRVFVGDVFFLAGQSNMAQTYVHQINEQLGGGVTTSNMPERVSDTRIKYVTIAQTSSASETLDSPFLNNTGWQSLTESTNKNLSYIGMFFARERLADEPNVPIGLISVAWRGTAIDAWMRKSDDNRSANYTPSNGKIYNNHVAPFIKYPVCAIMWYQGESDSGKYLVYEEAFQTMIKDYRKQWGKDDLPFLFVQLARYSKDDYQYMRESQRKALTLENTGMAVILDTDRGTYSNIHPLGKEDVAHRLYLLAKKYVYGEDIVAYGPLYESSRVEGNKIIVSFEEESIGDGLCIKNPYVSSQSLNEFEIASEDGNFVSANAVINGDNTVTVWADSIARPAYVRYAYSRVPSNPNLFNENGLPASPFTTDTRLYSAAVFYSYVLDDPDSAVQKAEFVLVPEKNNIDGVFNFTAKDNAITAWNNCGITMRFQKDGYFGYADGSAFVTGSIPYSAGNEYHFTVIADFSRKKFSVIVNGEVLCENADFRADALEMNDMSRFMVRGGNGAAANEFYARALPDLSAFSNAAVRANTADGDEAIFASSDGGYIFAAHYEENALKVCRLIKNSGGVSVLTLPAGSNKVFIWDELLRPIAE